MSPQTSAHPEPVEPKATAGQRPNPAHPEHVEEPHSPLILSLPKDLPDFLKSGDPALTWPLGKAASRNHPKGLPRGPYATDPQTAAHDLARDWLDHLAAGRIGGS